MHLISSPAEQEMESLTGMRSATAAHHVLLLFLPGVQNSCDRLSLCCCRFPSIASHDSNRQTDIFLRKQPENRKENICSTFCLTLKPGKKVYVPLTSKRSVVVSFCFPRTRANIRRKGLKITFCTQVLLRASEEKSFASPFYRQEERKKKKKRRKEKSR